jgi:competence protein ComEA
MQKIRFWVRKYFAFSQRETSGFLALLAIILVLLVLPFLYKPKAEPYNNTRDLQILDSLAAVLDDTEEARRSTFSSKKATVALRPFNPNELSEQEWN